MFNKFKNFLKSKPIIRQLVADARRQFYPTTADILQRMVKMAASYVYQPIFIKVGANDGVTGDPFGKSLISNQAWRGILIEPVPYCVKRLRRIYSDESRFTVVQCAVGSHSSTSTFYYVAEQARDALPDLPVWFDQLGSFDRMHIVKHLDGRLEPFILSMDVTIAPLTDILQEYKIERVTLLHIDVEGFDLDVLKSLALPELVPSWIMIEHKHLSPEANAEMFSILEFSGYDVFDLGDDYFAMYRESRDGLHRRGRVGRILDQR